MSRILITGASGYIGARLAFLLAARNHEITAHCFPTQPKDETWIGSMDRVIEGDLTSSDVIDELTDLHHDCAIHLVSLDHHASNKPPNFVNSINVLPVWNLLESFKQKNTLRRFIYFSTIQVYGNMPTGIIKESNAASPRTAYGLTHLMGENICKMYNNSSELECLSVRLSNSYGEPYFHDSNCWWLVVNDLCRAAYLQGKIELKSDGSPLRDFIHFHDIAAAIDLIVNARSEDLGDTYQLSSGKSRSILELSDMVMTVFNQRYGKSITRITPGHDEPKKKLSAPAFTISNDNLRSLGFNPSVDLEQGINSLFAYFELHSES